MGHRITQHIYTCGICGKTPENGEYLWHMNSDTICKECIDKAEEEEEKEVNDN